MERSKHSLQPISTMDLFMCGIFGIKSSEPDDKIILVVGPSGSGKDAVVNKAAQDFKFQKLVSYTTRPRRESDADDAHVFVTDAEYDKLKNIVAETEYHGYRYCATQEQVESAHLYIIDPAGIDFFREKYTGRKRVIVVYIKTNIIVRLFRLCKRDGFFYAAKRIANDIKAFYGARNKSDKTISNNGNIQDACTDIWLTLMYG
ncbi:MAG: hypothetical protein GX025_10765 [Clostridiales bacterium]|nr:hypothetical protein [Clostridiales bacterium]